MKALLFFYSADPVPNQISDSATASSSSLFARADAPTRSLLGAMAVVGARGTSELLLLACVPEDRVVEEYGGDTVDGGIEYVGEEAGESDEEDDVRVAVAAAWTRNREELE